MMGPATGLYRDGRGRKLLEERNHVLASQLLAKNDCLDGVHPVKLENML
jgi:hypothetical protein